MFGCICAFSEYTRGLNREVNTHVFPWECGGVSLADDLEEFAVDN
jgi:hypothetical protein